MRWKKNVRRVRRCGEVTSHLRVCFVWPNFQREPLCVCVCVWCVCFFFFFFFGWFAWSPRRIKTGDGALRDALTKKKKNVCVLEVLEVCVWARYKKRSQTLWHLRREEVWQCWSNSSGESGHSPPPLLRRKIFVVWLHYVLPSAWALSFTLHPFRFDQLCLHEPSQRSGLFNFTASPVCRGVLGGGVRARAIVRARACVRQLAAASFSAAAAPAAAAAAAAADPSHLLRVTGIEEIQVSVFDLRDNRGKTQGREAAAAWLGWWVQLWPKLNASKRSMCEFKH